MTRRIRRHPDFEISLTIASDAFIRPPREAQRNWLLNRAIKEFGDDLLALDRQARGYVRGAEPGPFADRGRARLDAQEIMEEWQIPVMRAMAAAVTDSAGDILEIGFGRGVAAAFIQQAGVRSHTIVECNPHIVADARAWAARRAGHAIRIVPGLWQEVIGSLAQYDGIFFHTYPLDEDEYIEQVSRSVTFAEHFFPVAAAHLRPGGRFSYLSNEADSLSRGHQRALFEHFASFALSRVTALDIPQDSRDVQWADSMVIVKAIR